MKKFRWMREAAASSTQAALERGDLASFEGEDDPDENDVKGMTEDGGEQVNCPTCGGDGKIQGGKVKCPDCKGSGKVPADSPVLREAARGPYWAYTDDHEVIAALREASRTFSTDKRDEYSKSGTAMPDGSFPIPDKDALGRAVKSVGRASDQGAAKAHIIKRAKALNATDQLPDGWTSTSKEAGSVEERLAAMEATLHEQTALVRSIKEAEPGHLNQVFENPILTTNSRGERGYEITLIREGAGNETDDAWYPGSAINEMCESGRAEGMQAYANHPTLEEEEQRPERDIRELIGTHTDVRYVVEKGVPKAKSIFVPVTTDDHHPHYGWVNTLAEAASRNKGPQPLVGWSLFGVSAGDDGGRPDGSEGRIVSLIMPTSGDMVTNAGAGGEFARKLMMESARRLRRAQPDDRKDEVMQITDFRNKMAEALQKVREADSDESRQAAMKELETLEGEAGKIEAASPPPDTVEALTEAAPALVQRIRESAAKEAGKDVESLTQQLSESNDQLGEAQKLLSGITNVTKLAEAVRSAGVTDDVEVRHFIGQAQVRGLSESEDIKSMIEGEQAYAKRQEDAILQSVREALGDEFPAAEGIIPRASGGSEEESTSSTVKTLAEAGVPMKETAAA